MCICKPWSQKPGAGGLQRLHSCSSHNLLQAVHTDLRRSGELGQTQGGLGGAGQLGAQRPQLHPSVTLDKTTASLDLRFIPCIKKDIEVTCAFPFPFGNLKL